MLTKTDFIHYLQCSKSLWLKHNRPEAYSEGQVSSFLSKLAAEGYEVESLAKQAVLCRAETNSYDFQREFLTRDGLYARSDIVKSNSNGTIDLFEIKSSTRVKDDKSRNHLKDAAFQVIVAERAGQRVDKVFIVHLNKDYVRSGELDPNKLMTFADETVRVKALIPETESEIDAALLLLKRSAIDETSCGCLFRSRAHHCDSFDYFNPSIPQPSIYCLPRLSEEKLTRFVNEGRFALSSISPDEVSKQQSLIVKANNENNPFIDKIKIMGFLGQLKYPLHFLDYETFSSAIPIIDGYGPQDQIPVQFSLHVLLEDGRLDHSEYLADRPMRPEELVNQLRDAIQPHGSILVWNATFENAQNRNLSVQIPDAKNFLADVIDRTIDLMEIFKTGYVDAGFDGSTSIKKVLPVLIPELSHHALDVNDGGAAMEAWGEMVSLTDPTRKRKLREDLLKYCELDTFAMVRIYQFIEHLMSDELKKI